MFVVHVYIATPCVVLLFMIQSILINEQDVEIVILVRRGW